jgi:hypothetical protein
MRVGLVVGTVGFMTIRAALHVLALTAALGAVAPQPGDGGRAAPPPVPANLAVPAGHRPHLVGHATGTQNYVCLPSGTGVAWTLFGPQATLFDDSGSKQLMTHFLSPNPDEAGTARATWQHSRDTSAVWARAIATSTDPAFVAPGAIPWLLLEVVGTERGPDGGDKLSRTTYIQRIDTDGGTAPAAGCSAATDAGARALVPYRTDYVFFRAAAATD